MRNIRKLQSPTSLEMYRRETNATYNSIPTEVKDDIRTALTLEQGWLCCYCMKRIEPTGSSMKIEHWVAQGAPGAEPGSDLEYRNLLGACTGSEDTRPVERHCDTHRGTLSKAQQVLYRNPSVPCDNVEARIRYTSLGKIKSADALLDKDIKTLNLNCVSLKNRRLSEIDAMLKALDKKGGQRTKSVVQSLLAKYEEQSEGKLKPFCQVAIYFLRIRLSRAR